MTGFLMFLLIVILLGLFGYTWYRLHKEVHMHVKSYDDHPEKYGLPFVRMENLTKDGLKIVGWYIPVQNPKAVIVMVHGRTTEEGGKSLFLSHAHYLLQHGYAVYLFDMRAIGESEGKTITLGVREWQDVVATYETVRALPELKGKKIGLYGISMGAATSLIAAGKNGIGDFVIATVPYSSFSSLFGYQVEKEKLFPRFLFTWLLQLAALIELGPFYFFYNPINFISRIKVPLFLMSAKKDELVNPKDPWLLYEKARKPKEFWEANAPHDIHSALPHEFEEKVLNFLQIYAA